MKLASLYTLVAIAALSVPCPAAASSKPVPGGANQVAGVQAAYPNTVFNGFIRIKPKYFGPARPEDNIIEKPADANTKVMVFSGTISDGSTKPYLDNPLIVLADADGVTVTARSVQPNGIILQQAAGAKLTVVFWVPNDFVPDHLTYTCQSARCKAIRITFKH
jgi:hypothetical protein